MSDKAYLILKMSKKINFPLHCQIFTHENSFVSNYWRLDNTAFLRYTKFGGQREPARTEKCILPSSIQSSFCTYLSQEKRYKFPNTVSLGPELPKKVLAAISMKDCLLPYEPALQFIVQGLSLYASHEDEERR